MADRTVSVKLRADVAEYMRNMRTAGRATSDLEKASKQLQIAFDAEEDAAGKVRVAEAQLADAQKSGKATATRLAKAQEQLATAQRKYARSQEETILATRNYESVQHSAGDSMDETVEQFDESSRDIDKIAKRTQVQFRALAVAIAAAAPAVGAAAIGVAATAAAASFVGLGAVALRESERVTDAWSGLGRELQTGIAADAAVLEEPFVDAASEIGSAFQQMRPQLRGAFADSVPHVETLTDGVIDLAQNALPGVTRSVSEAGPAVEGFADLLAKTGTGLSGLFDEVAEGSESAGLGMQHLGDLMAGTLPELGGILNNLSDLWAEHGDVAVEVINQLMSTLDNLTGGALPVFGSTLGATLQLLSSVLDVIEPISGILGAGIGVWLSYAAAMKAVGAARTAVGRVSDSVTSLGRNMDRSSKKATAFKVAGAAAAIGIGALAAATRDTAGDVSQMTDDLDRFAKTGKLGGEAARVLGKNFENVGESLDVMGSGFENSMNKFAVSIPIVGQLADSLTGFSDATQDIKDFDAALSSQVGAGNFKAAQEAVAAAAKQSGMSIEELKGRLPGYTAALESASAKMKELGTSSMQSRPGIEQLQEALTTLGQDAASTEDKVDALNTAWRELFGVSLSMEEAKAAFEEGLDSIAESIDAAREAGGEWRKELLNANGTIDLTTEAGRELSENLIQQGENYRTLAQTAYDSAIKQGLGQDRATQAAVDAVTKRRRQFHREIADLNLTEGQARELERQYLGMPNTVVTAIHTPGMLSAISRAQSLLGTLNSFPPVVSTVVQAAMPGFLPGLSMLAGMADGGKVEGYAGGGKILGPGTGTSDSIPGFAEGAPIKVSNGEYISTADSTDRNESALAAGNRGATLVALDGQGRGARMVTGAPQAAPVTYVSATFNFPNYVGSRSEITSALRKEIRNLHGGDVARALGGKAA